MSWIEEIKESEANEELRELFDRARGPQGELDNILRIHSLHPEGLSAHLDLYRAVMKGTASLRAVDRELIAYCVSRWNDCHY